MKRKRDSNENDGDDISESEHDGSSVESTWTVPSHDEYDNSDEESGRDDYHEQARTITRYMEENDFDSMNWLLSSGVHVKALNMIRSASYGNDTDDEVILTPLHWACKKGQVELVDLMLESHADLEVQNEEGNTPLHIVCYGKCQSDLELVRSLVNDGANIDARNHQGQTPLSVATFSKRSPEVADFLIEVGADIHMVDKEGTTILHCACQTGFLDITKILVEEEDADIHVENKSQQTPLHFACAGGRSKIIKFLMERGARVNAKDNVGRTPLLVACGFIHGHGYKGLEPAKLLIEKGAMLNAKDNNGITPLYNACWAGRPKLVQFLLNQGANIHTTTKTGMAPLHIASQRNRVEVVWTLIRQCPWLVSE